MILAPSNYEAMCYRGISLTIPNMDFKRYRQRSFVFFEYTVKLNTYTLVRVSA